jgi:mono/diheme cytochrome c family protein
MNRGIWIALWTASFLLLVVAYAASRPDGAALFRREGCIGCHVFQGQGGFMGPDLTAVRNRRSRGWIREQIKNSRQHNPNSAMPSFDHLSWREINALIAYLEA